MSGRVGSREPLGRTDVQKLRELSSRLLVHALLGTEGLVENGDEQVGAHGDPDLRLHCVFAGAVEGLDSQVLFEPFEEQLDLPTCLIDFRDDDGLDLEVVGEEDQVLSGLGIQTTALLHGLTDSLFNRSIVVELRVDC
jgi:hypothetical protein